MKIVENIELASYTTIRIGGRAKKLFFPETTEELIELLKMYGSEHILGGGSNLLISDEHEFDTIICLKELNKSIDNLRNGEYSVGASVRLQKLINTINADGYGGIEYLYSVPGLVGGAVFMNAGGGIEEGNSISDYIETVTVVHDGKAIELEKEKCDFSHRSSLFKNKGEYVVVSVKFKFVKQEISLSKSRIQERLALTKRIHDLSKPNFGSVFCQYNPYIMSLVKRTQHFHDSGVWFSCKTDNWLINCGGGTYREAIKRIESIKQIHRLFHLKCKTEVIIWD